MTHNETLCSNASWVFKSFDRLAYCFNTFGGVADANPFTNVVNQCLNDYCQSPYPQLGGCGDWSGSMPLNFEVVNPGYQYYNGYSFFENSQTCVNINKDVNPDIAGPGMWTAYLMQLTMIFYFWFFLRAYRLIPKITTFIRRLTTKGHQPTPPKNPQSQLRTLFSKHDTVLQAMLVEFQEAQCFFMLASQAAILGARSHKGIFQSYTIRALWANNGVAGIVCSAGILPIVIGMWTLQKLRMSSPWIFALSVATLMLSEFALYWTKSPPRPDQLMTIEYSRWPKTCGGHAPPLVWCPDQSALVNERIPLLFFWQDLNPFCLAVFGLVVLMWFGQLLCKFWDVKTSCERLFARGGLQSTVSGVQRLFDSKLGRWLKRLPSLITVGVELLLIFAVAVDAICFYEFSILGLIKWDNWTFGQLVGITLWFPVVSKYIYWMMFGTKAYSAARVPEPYRIVKGKKRDDLGDTETHEFAMLPSMESVAYKA